MNTARSNHNENSTDLDSMINKSQELKAIINSMYDGVALIDPEGRIVKINSRLEELGGYSRKEIEGKYFQSLSSFTSESQKRLLAAFERHMAGKEVGSYEVKAKTKDGKEKYFRINSSPYSKNGEIRGVVAIFHDITDLKHTEKKLKESRDQYKLLSETIQEGVLILDFKGNVLYANEFAFVMFGFPKDAKLVGINVFRFVAPESRARVIQDQLAVLRGKGGFLSEYKVRTKDGREIWVEGLGTKIRYKEKTANLVSLRDITEKKLADKIIRKHRERLDSVVQNINGLVYQCLNDSYWTMKFLSSGCEKLTGYKREEVLENRTIAYNDIIHPEDRDAVRDAVQAAIREGGQFKTEYRIVRKDGTERWVWEQGQKVGTDNGTAILDGFITDITERKEISQRLEESEKRYKIVTDQTGLLIYDYDVITGEIKWFGAIDQITGYSADEFEKVNIDEWEQMIHPEDRDQAVKMLHQAGEKHKTYRTEYRYRQKNGEYIHVDDNGTFLFDQAGKPYRMLGIMRDITEQKKLEIELKKRDIILETVNFAAKRFLVTQEFDTNVSDFLELLGKSMEVDRVYISENQTSESGDLLTSRKFEWVDDEIAPQINNPELQNVSYVESGFSRWREQLSAKSNIYGHVGNFPRSEQDLLHSQNIQSVIIMPIFVKARWWGFLGLDVCREKKVWSHNEVEALERATEIVGAAITQKLTSLELRKRNAELERLNKVMVGRELKMIELKRKIKNQG